MKKLALFLVPVMLFTCLMLASCGGSDETSAAESDAASVETSVEATSSTEPAATSETESTEPDDETSAAIDTSKTNLALNCTVTGADPSTHDNNKNYNGQLTDGNASDAGQIGVPGEWFCYYQNTSPDADPKTWNIADTENRVGSAVVDLGAAKDISAVRVHVFTGNNWGILAPKYVAVSYSEDGNTYTKISEVMFADCEAGVMQAEWAEFALNAPAKARYVKVDVQLNGIFAFLNEIEVYE